MPDPVAGPGELLVDVERVGICGTDVELYTGEMAYIEQGHTHFPLRLGHEWTGRVSAVGYRRGRALARQARSPATRCSAAVTATYCAAGHHHVCPNRFEVGIRGGWAGALAEKVRDPDAVRLRDPRARDASPPPRSSSRAATRCAPSGPRASSPATACSSSGRARSACSPPSSPSRRAPRCTSAGCARDRSRSRASLGVPHTWHLDDLAGVGIRSVRRRHRGDEQRDDARARGAAGKARRSRRVHRAVRRRRASSTPATSRSRTSPPSASCRPRPGSPARSRASRAARSCPMRSSARSSPLEEVPDRFEGRRGARGRTGSEGARRSAAEPLSERSHDERDAIRVGGREAGRRRPRDRRADRARRPPARASPSMSWPASCTARSRQCIGRWRPCGERDSRTWPGAGCTCSATSTCGSRSATSTARPETARIQPLLEDLATQFGETAHYAVLSGPDIVYRAKMDPPQGAVRLTSVIGGRNPAYRTAVGKALLSERLVDLRGVTDWFGPFPLEPEDPEHPDDAATRFSPNSTRRASAVSASTTRRTRSASTASRSRSTSTAPTPRRERSASALSDSELPCRPSRTRSPRSGRRSPGISAPTRSADRRRLGRTECVSRRRAP